ERTANLIKANGRGAWVDTGPGSCTASSTVRRRYGPSPQSAASVPRVHADSPPARAYRRAHPTHLRKPGHLRSLIISLNRAFAISMSRCDGEGIGSARPTSLLALHLLRTERAICPLVLRPRSRQGMPT